MSKKRLIAFTGTAFLAGAIVMFPYSSIADSLYKRLSINQAADIMVKNDIQTQITLEDEELANWRIAFLPGDGYTPPGSHYHSSWAAAYRTNVQPLRREATQLQEDYGILSGELQREAVNYTLLYNYWLLEEQLEVTEANLALAKEEHELAKKRLEVGQISQTDLYQVETSMNNAQISYDEALRNYKGMQYQINQNLGQNLSQSLDIYETKFSFLPDAQLNIRTLKNELFESHPSLGYTKKELEAFQKGHEVVTAENFTPSSEALPIYLEREVAYWQLRLDQQKDQLEYIAHSLVDELQQLKTAITLHEQNLEHGYKVYEAAVLQYEQGLSTYLDVEQARLNLHNTRLQLTTAKKAYLEQKENLRLLKEGHIPTN